VVRRAVVVKCFRCGEEGHKCKECPLWKKKEKAARMARSQKVQQKEKPAHPEKEKAQEKKRRLRRVEEGEAARPIKGEVQQGEWRRSSWEQLRKRAEWYCRPTVP